MKNVTMTVSGSERLPVKLRTGRGDTVAESCTKDKRDEMNLKIVRFLYGVGIQITSVGFHYFYTAIKICMQDKLAPTNAQKNIYMVIADRYNVSYKSVERAMRVAFTEAVSLRAVRLFEKEMRLFSFNKSSEITPLEFISLVAMIVTE